MTRVPVCALVYLRESPHSIQASCVPELLLQGIQFVGAVSLTSFRRLFLRHLIALLCMWRAARLPGGRCLDITTCQAAPAVPCYLLTRVGVPTASKAPGRPGGLTRSAPPSTRVKVHCRITSVVSVQCIRSPAVHPLSFGMELPWF